MSKTFQIWTDCLIPLILLTLMPFAPADTDRNRQKKIQLPSHITHHQPVLCWVLRFHYGLNETDYSRENILLNLTYTNSVGEFNEDHHVYCHQYESIKDGKFPLLQKHHNEIRRENETYFNELVANLEDQLEHDPAVEWYSQETVRSREKRSVVFLDPSFHRQWHLENHQINQMDINVTGVWERNVTGHGITVAVVDDGVEWTNKDLYENYNFMGSWDLNDDDSDAMPSDSKINNHHGTRCAGEIAAVANNICGVGVAYKAKISGLRVLDGPMTDSLEASAFNKKMQINDIYSCSWGPDDDGKTVDGPHIMAAKAMKYGVDFGRKGYGSIFVVASGNGGRHHDNCNYDGYANSIYTVTIGAVDEIGRMPYYAEECASMLGVTFSSGKANNRDIVTTDWTKRNGAGCTDRHTGTSAAAPLAAGMIALMLQVQPCLTWRDVQYIIILTAQKVDVDVAHWHQNGAGLYHSHKHGFGLLKAWRLVNAAKIWDPVPWITSFTYGEKETNLKIPKNITAPLIIEHTITKEDIQGYDLYILEYVQVTVTITHPKRGKLSLQLACPSGTKSVIGASRPLDNSNAGFSDWTFTTVRCWGEKPVGKWMLIVTDADTGPIFGFIKKWNLRLFGTPMSTEEFQKRRVKIEEAMSGAFLNDSYIPACHPPPVTAKPDVPITLKTLKILVLASAFCFVMGVYESLEYLLCYNEEKAEHQRRTELVNRAQNMSQNARHSSGEDEDSITESTGLLHEASQDIPLQTQAFTEVPDSVLNNSNLEEVNPDCGTPFLDRTTTSGHNVGSGMCSVDVGDDVVPCDNLYSQFETLSLSDEEKVPSGSATSELTKLGQYDWLKYTKK